MHEYIGMPSTIKLISNRECRMLRQEKEKEKEKEKERNKR